MAARKPVEEAPPLPTTDQWNTYCEQMKLNNPGWVPPEQLTLDDIQIWTDAKRMLDDAKDLEMRMRNKVFRHLFPNPVEGANNVQLMDGRKITATHVISRKPDEVLIDAMGKRTVGDMRLYLTNLKIDVSAFADEELVVNALGLRLDELFKYKPELVIGDYRKLTEAQLILADSLLEVKPGSPQVKIVSKGSE